MASMAGDGGLDLAVVKSEVGTSVARELLGPYLRVHVVML